MAEAVLGSAFTFQVLFVDSAGVPMAVNTPTIDVFNYSQTGVKQPLVTAQAMDPATPVEIGRYTYAYTIPTTMDDGDAIYGEMWGIDPGSGDTMRADQAVTIISSNRGLGSQPGMSTEFF